jgi:hypothetical protein
MKRRWVATVAAAAAIGAVIGLVPASPAQAEETLIRVCVTLNPREVSVAVAGNEIIGQSVPGQPRSCGGI